MSDDRDEQVFHYNPPWQKWAVAFAIMVGFTWYHLNFGYGSWAVEEPNGPADAVYLAMILLVVGGLGALPAITLLLLAQRGHFTVGPDGVRWQRWWREHAMSWDEIRAVGEPREEKTWRWWRHFWFERRSSIRVITDEDWRDIQCALLPEGGQTAYEAIARGGGFSETLEHDGRSFRCRPEWDPADLPDSHPWKRVQS